MRRVFSMGRVAQLIRLLGMGVVLLFPAAAQNLLTNGDFETGTVSGFSTTLTASASGTMAYGTYRIATSAAGAGASWLPTADHTPGSGQYMFITRGTNGNNTVTPVWSTTVSQTTNTRYTFSGWAAVPTSLTAARTPTFRLVARGGGVTNTFNFTSPTTAWGFFLTGYLYTGTTGNVTYTLSIVNGSQGNNQADAISWDDFRLTAPEPSTYAGGLALAGVVGWQWYRVRRRRCSGMAAQAPRIPDWEPLREGVETCGPTAGASSCR